MSDAVSDAPRVNRAALSAILVAGFAGWALSSCGDDRSMEDPSPLERLLSHEAHLREQIRDLLDAPYSAAAQQQYEHVLGRLRQVRGDVLLELGKARDEAFLRESLARGYSLPRIEVEDDSDWRTQSRQRIAALKTIGVRIGWDAYLTAYGRAKAPTALAGILRDVQEHARLAVRTWEDGEHDQRDAAVRLRPPLWADRIGVPGPNPLRPDQGLSSADRRKITTWVERWQREVPQRLRRYLSSGDESPLTLPDAGEDCSDLLVLARWAGAGAWSCRSALHDALEVVRIEMLPHGRRALALLDTTFETFAKRRSNAEVAAMDRTPDRVAVRQLLAQVMPNPLWVAKVPAYPRLWVERVLSPVPDVRSRAITGLVDALGPSRAGVQLLEFAVWRRVTSGRHVAELIHTARRLRPAPDEAIPLLTGFIRVEVVSQDVVRAALHALKDCGDALRDYGALAAEAVPRLCRFVEGHKIQSDVLLVLDVLELMGHHAHEAAPTVQRLARESEHEAVRSAALRVHQAMARR